MRNIYARKCFTLTAVLIVVLFVAWAIMPVTIYASRPLPLVPGELLAEGGRSARCNLSDDYMADITIHSSVINPGSDEVSLYAIMFVGDLAEFIDNATTTYSDKSKVPVRGDRTVCTDGELMVLYKQKSYEAVLHEHFFMWKWVKGSQRTTIYFFFDEDLVRATVYDPHDPQNDFGSKGPIHDVSRPKGSGSVYDFLRIDEFGAISLSIDKLPPNPYVPTVEEPTIKEPIIEEPTVVDVLGGGAERETPSSWAMPEVERAIKEELVLEFLRSRYTAPITRAEFAALAVTLFEKAMARPIVVDERISFADTKDIYVLKAASIGVVQGVGGGRFDPDAQLTREQAATMLYRLADACGAPLPGALNPMFADANQISIWARTAVGGVEATQIMRGTGDRMFSPLDPYTREQSILTILRLLEWIEIGHKSWK